MPIRLLSVLAFATLVIGCGGPTLVPVSGTVTLDQKPLAGAYLTFEPVQGAGELVSTGVTDEAGEYTLSCGDEPGAVPGMHRVIMTTVAPGTYKDELSVLPQDRIPPRYQDGSLTYEVPAEGADSADFVLRSR